MQTTVKLLLLVNVNATKIVLYDELNGLHERTKILPKGQCGKLLTEHNNKFMDLLIRCDVTATHIFDIGIVPVRS